MIPCSYPIILLYIRMIPCSYPIQSLFDLVWTTNAYRANRTYVLRNDQEFFIPPARLSLTAKHPYHIFPKTWAEFDIHEIKIQKKKLYLTHSSKITFLTNLTAILSVAIYYDHPVILSTLIIKERLNKHKNIIKKYMYLQAQF